MTIPETQLQTWSNQGATVTAEDTHKSVRNALASYRLPDGISYEPYLQGSYRNFTNIRGDSDVDLVVELNSVMYSNLTEDEKIGLGLQSVTYDWYQFRQDVIAALSNYYGTEYVDTSGSKSIKLLPSGGRIKADIVVCANYKYYSNMRVFAEGMTFWALPGWQQIINYPKLHYRNGASKNSDQHARGWYRPSIRLLKNSRNRILENNNKLNGRFPSYFIEGLLYNVPDNKFSSSYQDTFVNVVNWLNDNLPNDDVENFVCQNKMNYLFGISSVQWNVADAREFVSQLITLWNNW